MWPKLMCTQYLVCHLSASRRASILFGIGLTSSSPTRRGMAFYACGSPSMRRSFSRSLLMILSRSGASCLIIFFSHIHVCSIEFISGLSGLSSQYASSIRVRNCSTFSVGRSSNTGSVKRPREDIVSLRVGNCTGWFRACRVGDRIVVNGLKLPDELKVDADEEKLNKGSNSDDRDERESAPVVPAVCR